MAYKSYDTYKHGTYRPNPTDKNGPYSPSDRNPNLLSSPKGGLSPGGRKPSKDIDSPKAGGCFSPRGKAQSKDIPASPRMRGQSKEKPDAKKGKKATFANLPPGHAGGLGERRREERLRGAWIMLMLLFSF